jgi:hypothetical protein
MTESLSRSGEASNDDKPYTIHTNPVPIDMLSEGPGGECWYRVPSWRVTFKCEALAGVDARAHRSLGSYGAWTLSEASTGFEMFSELPEDHGSMEGMLAEFTAGVMLKLTPELVAHSIAKAKKILAGRTPSPFVASETEGWVPVSERQPKRYGPYLIFFVGAKRAHEGLWQHSEVSGKGHWNFATVTHWQPLPETPHG